MIKHLETCNISVLKPMWQDIEVWRGQQSLGSVRWIAQAFTVWKKDHKNH